MPVLGQKFVILGGAGLLGSAVAHDLISTHRANVIVCDNFGDVSRRKWANLPSAVDDIWSPDALFTNLDKSWREIAGVVLLADAEPETGDADALFEASYHLPRRVWDFCVAKQRPLYWASSAHIYGDGTSQLSRDAGEVAALMPVTAFGRVKQAFDVFAARQGTGPTTPPVWTGLRLSSVYGKGEHHMGDQASLPVRALTHAKTGSALDICEASMNQTHDWVHVDDGAAAIASVVTRGHAGFFDIGTGVATSTQELITQVEAVSRKRLAVSVNASASLARSSMAIADTSALQAIGISIPFRSLTQGLGDL